MKPKKEVTLSENSSRAAKARWAQKTPEERSTYAKMMVDAREAKRAAKPYHEIDHSHCWNQGEARKYGLPIGGHEIYCLCGIRKVA